MPASCGHGVGRVARAALSPPTRMKRGVVAWQAWPVVPPPPPSPCLVAVCVAHTAGSGAGSGVVPGAGSVAGSGAGVGVGAGWPDGEKLVRMPCASTVKEPSALHADMAATTSSVVSEHRKRVAMPGARFRVLAARASSVTATCVSRGRAAVCVCGRVPVLCRSVPPSPPWHAQPSCGRLAPRAAPPSLRCCWPPGREMMRCKRVVLLLLALSLMPSPFPFLPLWVGTSLLP